MQASSLTSYVSRLNCGLCETTRPNKPDMWSKSTKNNTITYLYLTQIHWSDRDIASISAWVIDLMSQDIDTAADWLIAKLCTVVNVNGMHK